MRALFYIVILLISYNSFSQRGCEFDNKKYVSNTCNTELLKIPAEYRSVPKSEYVFKGKIVDLFKFYIDEKEYDKIYKTTNIKREYTGSGLAFSIEGEENIIYAYPINNEVFNSEYFNRELDPSIHQTGKIYVAVYNSKKRDFPVVVIEKVILDK